MTLSARLADILERARDAARTGGTPARALPSASAAERLQSVLGEIEETVLPRALTFSLAGGGDLVVEARSRFAAKLGAPGEAGDEPPAEAPPPGTDPAERVEIMADAVLAFVLRDGDVTVVSRPTALPASFVRKGYPTEELGQAVRDKGGEALAEQAPARRRKSGGKQSAPGTDKPLGGLYAALAEADLSVAQVTRSGKVKSAGGARDEAQTTDLARAAASLAEAAAPFADAILPGPRLLVLLPEDTGDDAFCIGCDGKAIVMGITRGEGVDDLAGAWQQASPEGDA